MRVCLMIEGQEGVSWDEWRALARACEQHGFDALFRSDHYLSMSDPTRDALDAWSTIPALAALTSRLRLGTLVSPATFRHPSVLAKAAVSADHVSGGRVELGLGAGWFEREHAEFGFPFPPLGERMDVLAEQLEIVRRSWGDEPFSVEGRHYRIVDCDPRPKPLQGRLPLIVGGGAAPRSAALAARWADEYNTVAVGPEECARRRAAVVQAFEDVGRDPGELTFSLMTPCLVGVDGPDLERRGRRLAERLGRDGGVEAARAELGEGAVVGTVEQVVERLREYERAGVGRVMLQHLVHEDLETVELIGRSVIPAVSSAGR